MLGKNWISENINDFEYFKYSFLAYLQEIDNWYKEKKVFPHLHELQDHYIELSQLKESKGDLESLFPNRLTKIDLKEQKLIFEGKLKNSEIIKELEKMMEFCLPLLHQNLLKGFSLVDLIKASLFFEPIGVEPMYLDEGYLLLNAQYTNHTHVYQYKKSSLDYAAEEYKEDFMTISYVKHYRNSLTWTPENIKYDLIKSNEEFPNPATYMVLSEKDFPINETLLPVAKEIIFTHIKSV